jgi:membrane fusion protein (multidrug efflux system)
MDVDLKNNSKAKMVAVLILATGVMLFAGIAHFVYNLGRVSTDDAYIEGRIHSIAAKIPGTVLDVSVDDNQGVKKGDTLVAIDPTDYEVKEKEAAAALDAEKAKLAEAEAGIRTAAANLEIQMVTMHQATLDEKRADALYKEAVIPKERFEKTRTAYELAGAQVRAMKEQLEHAKATKSLEESTVKQKDALLQIAKLNLGYTKIVAPSDGYVTQKSVEAGNQIQANQPLMAVIALDDIWLIANFKETQLKNVKPGQPVRIKVDTYSGRTFTGKVDSIMAGTGAAFSLFPPENALGNYVKVVQRIPVKIVFDQAQDTRRVLRIGMSCLVTITTKDE